MKVDEAHSVEKAKKPRYVKPIGYGKCPSCMAPRVAIIRAGLHDVWKGHKVRTMSGASIDCHATGVAVCQLGEGNPPLQHDPIRCKCGGSSPKEGELQ